MRPGVGQFANAGFQPLDHIRIVGKLAVVAGTGRCLIVHLDLLSGPDRGHFVQVQGDVSCRHVGDCCVRAGQPVVFGLGNRAAV